VLFRACCYFDEAPTCPTLRDKSIAVRGVITYKDRVSEEHD